jgi:hypothetical protein
VVWQWLPVEGRKEEGTRRAARSFPMVAVGSPQCQFHQENEQRVRHLEKERLSCFYLCLWAKHCDPFLGRWWSLPLWSGVQ